MPQRKGDRVIGHGVSVVWVACTSVREGLPAQEQRSGVTCWPKVPGRSLESRMVRTKIPFFFFPHPIKECSISFLQCPGSMMKMGINFIFKIITDHLEESPHFFLIPIGTSPQG